MKATISKSDSCYRKIHGVRLANVTNESIVSYIPNRVCNYTKRKSDKMLKTVTKVATKLLANVSVSVVIDKTGIAINLSTGK